MRLLHTSDWHLGHSLHQFDRSWEHERFLDWLLDTLEAEAVDALLIAGDVFDNSNPPAASQALLYRFLTGARRRVPHLQIVLTAGNHDSPGRLEAPAPFLSLFEATVIGHARIADRAGRSDAADAAPNDDAVNQDIARLVVPLRNRAGDIAAWCIAMPFLRPGDVPRINGAGDDGTQDAYAAGVAALYRQAFEVASARRLPGQAIVATGHCHLTGGQVSEESERRIVIGGAEALSARLFDPGIAYVALGHLHLAQRVGGDETRRYSGSPLPMSFSEVDYPHQVVVIDLEGEGVGAVRTVPVPRTVRLLRIPPRPAPLATVLAALESLELPGTSPNPQAAQHPAPMADAAWPYLQVRVQLDQPEPGLRAQVEKALVGKPVRLARIETTTVRAVGSAERALPVSIDELAALDPETFFRRLYHHRFGDEAPEALLGAFSELLAAGDDGEVGA